VKGGKGKKGGQIFLDFSFFPIDYRNKKLGREETEGCLNVMLVQVKKDAPIGFPKYP